MLTLGIETSCDETSCAVLGGRDEVKSNIVSSSLFRHRPFGGIVPEIASRHCLEQIDFVFHQALEQAKVRAQDLDLIAVTQGPGLIGSLLVGVSFAKALSLDLNIPLVAVNHLEAHLEAAFVTNEGKFPGVISSRRPARFIGLLVSGGHTHLTLHEKEKVIGLGETVDDAVGEAYDKVAKIMGLGYPGGPILDRLAKEGNPRAVAFTKPKQKNRYDFSFSGIKTAVLYYYQREHSKHKSQQALDCFHRDLAASFQNAVVSWLVEKTMAAAKEYSVSDIVVGGGVSANAALRTRLTAAGEEDGLCIRFPHLSLTNDNAAMIARRGLELFKKGRRAAATLSGDPNLRMV